MPPISLFEKWVTTHGIPMVVTVVVIYLLFRYFLKRLDTPTNNCKPSIEALTKEVKTLSDKVEQQTIIVNKCQNSLSTLKGFLSGLYFRNRGMVDDDE